MSLLERILAAKRAEIIAGTRCAHAAVALPACDVVSTLSRARDRRVGGGDEALRILAEVKRKSPSAGELSKVLTAGERARTYADAGASAVSVLCDGPFFGGSFEDVAASVVALRAARRAVPVLAKEYVLDEAQLDWATAHGASIVLLIARIVSPALLGTLVAAALARGIEPLVEVAHDGELRVALDAGARVIGVNARDLDTLVIDRSRAARVLEAIPEGHVAVHLSGVKSPEDVRGLRASRADAVLVGEALMRADDPGPLLKEMVAAAAG